MTNDVHFVSLYLFLSSPLCQTSSDPILKAFTAGVGWSRWPSIFEMCLRCHRSWPLLSAGRIGAPQIEVRGQTILSGDGLVGAVRQCTVFSQGGVVSPLVGNWGASCGV
jgi:hypothetical protein